MGSPATVVPDAYPNRRFNASLVKIYPAADRQKGTVKIEVQIDKPDLQVTKPEMSVKVSFWTVSPTAGNEPLLIIPKDTVRADGGETYVWAVRGGLARRVPIVRGRDVESGVEVKQGLKDGDMLVLAPPRTSAMVLKSSSPIRHPIAHEEGVALSRQAHRGRIMRKMKADSLADLVKMPEKMRLRALVRKRAHAGALRRKMDPQVAPQNGETPAIGTT